MPIDKETCRKCGRLFIPYRVDSTYGVVNSTICRACRNKG